MPYMSKVNLENQRYTVRSSVLLWPHTIFTCCYTTHGLELVEWSLNHSAHEKTDVLLESLCTDLMMNDLAAVESEKSNLEEKVAAMEKMYESVTTCGASFIDDLSAEEVNSHGKRVVRNYMAGVVHVREQLSAARERRKRCLELVDVRRLKLQQFTQLFTCENDAQQAIKWLEELHETLLKDYNQMGVADDDLRCLARGSYETGRNGSKHVRIR
ncbi:hypothetical protein KIN20_006206 [Parelaphostrongylus tenuis]|uniref:SESTD1-like spectrin repeats region domain-containing protein n=1 Tax=Parelaphostrongylus tenuis TaxID=148309 RepID=A0AAD5MJU4_PARTN|nr:hypothetical protein KIN20_006206 [Parelaphostrongylus tenuis]